MSLDLPSNCTLKQTCAAVLHERWQLRRQNCILLVALPKLIKRSVFDNNQQIALDERNSLIIANIIEHLEE